VYEAVAARESEGWKRQLVAPAFLGFKRTVMNQIARDLVPGHELSVEENSYGKVNGLSPGFHHD
jgi:hypothetical protein